MEKSCKNYVIAIDGEAGTGKSTLAKNIAQKYGIRLAALYRMNYKDEDYAPYVGDILRVR